MKGKSTSKCLKPYKVLLLLINVFNLELNIWIGIDPVKNVCLFEPLFMNAHIGL